MINDHKFYNEYILPVLEEIKEELNKHGVHANIINNKLVDNDDNTLVKYYADEGEYFVPNMIHELFSNKFDENDFTTELIFKPIQEPQGKSIYDLEIGDTIYYVNGFGGYRSGSISEGDTWYQPLLENDNLFLTQEECEKRIAKNQAISKIKKRAHELQGCWKPDWKNHPYKKYYIVWDSTYKILKPNHLWYMQNGAIYFNTEETAQQIIDELPEECKLMLGVE